MLTICQQKTVQSARELAYLLEHLAENEFETSKLVRTRNNALISEWNGKPVMLKIFLDGEIIKDLPNHILEAIGGEVGKLHQIESPTYIPKILNYGIEHFAEVGDYAAGSSFEIWLKEVADYMQPFLAGNLPKSLIHSDVFFSNIVVRRNGDSVCIMDFEEATHYYRVFDIGMTLVGLCCDGKTLNQGKARALLSGYQQKIELQELEKKSLQAFTVYAAASMTFWRHRNFNYNKPNSEMYDHYLGLKVIADSVKNIASKSFADIF